jgi:hypothetical protein
VSDEPPLSLASPEVHDLGPALRRDHDVSALDVSVGDAFAVGLPQAGRDLVDEADGLPGLERPFLDLIAQRLALHILHGDVGAIFAFTDFMDDADVRMGQRRSRLCLDEKALFELGRIHDVRRQELQGHGPLELEVLGLVDDPHPALADLLEDLVLAGDKRSGLQDVERGFQGLGDGSALSACTCPRPERSGAVAAEFRVIPVFSVAARAFHWHLASSLDRHRI